MKYLLLKHYRGGPAAGQRRADGPLDAGGGRRAHPVHARLRGPPGGDGRVRRRPGAGARGRVGAVRRRGAPTGDRWSVRRDQGPHRRLDGHRRGVLGSRGRAGRGAVRRARRRRQADPRVARSPAVPHPARATVQPSERVAAAGARARGDRHPRPARSGLRVGRGCRAGGPDPGAGDLAGRSTARSEGHGSSRSRGAGSSTPPVPRRRGGGGSSPWRSSLPPVRCPPRTTRCGSTSCARTPPCRQTVGRRPDAARGRWPDHAADRDGLPRPRGDHGAADQPGQAAARRAAARPARRSRDGAARALPRLQRGVQRRRRPGGRGDPPHPPARRPDRRARGRGAARAHAAAPCAPRVAHRPGRSPGAAWPSRTDRAGTPA